MQPPAPSPAAAASLQRLPLDLLRVAFQWLPGRDAADARTVSPLWNRLLLNYVTAVCVHRYANKQMECRVVHCTQHDTVGEILKAYSPHDTLYYFPHCRPAVFGGCGRGGTEEEREAAASPTYAVPHDTPVRELLINRLLVSDKCAHDSFLDNGSFENYMQLLLKLQIKHQEYVFEHHARIRLLRTYISNLEHRVACKLKLLVEQLGFLCIRHMVVLLPQLEAAIRGRQDLRSAAVKIQLAKYRLLQDQVEQERGVLEAFHHAALTYFDMNDLEEYSAFLCRADDELERHVELCRTDQAGLEQPGAALWLLNTRLPDDCRLQPRDAAPPPEGGGADAPASHSQVDALMHTFARQSSLEETLKAVLKVRAEQLTYKGTSPTPIHLTSSSAVPQRALGAPPPKRPVTAAVETQTAPSPEPSPPAPAAPQHPQPAPAPPAASSSSIGSGGVGSSPPLDATLGDLQRLNLQRILRLVAARDALAKAQGGGAASRAPAAAPPPAQPRPQPQASRAAVLDSLLSTGRNRPDAAPSAPPVSQSSCRPPAAAPEPQPLVAPPPRVAQTQQSSPPAAGGAAAPTAAAKPAATAATLQELQKALTRLSVAAQAVQTHIAAQTAAVQRPTASASSESAPCAPSPPSTAPAAPSPAPPCVDEGPSAPSAASSSTAVSSHGTPGAESEARSAALQAVLARLRAAQQQLPRQ